jgi:hypothetical protein
VLYDISRLNFRDTAHKWLTPEEFQEEADRIKLQYVPTLYRSSTAKEGKNAYQVCNELLAKMEKSEIASCLGGRMEGFVVKTVRTSDSKKVARLGKFVTKQFKEKQSQGLNSDDRSKSSRTVEAFIENAGLRWNTFARFAKAYIHLKEVRKCLRITDIC